MVIFGVVSGDGCETMSEATLLGKVALITGASSGIGEATALALAEKGVKVALLARRTEKLQILSADISKRFSQKALILTGDVADHGSVTKNVEATLSQFGKIDILVNNAGVMYLGSVAAAKVADWKQMIDVNLMGLMYCTQAVIRHMQAAGGGNIVNISSVSGKLVSARSAVYSASKFAVNAFADGLRQEVYKDKIRVINIAPGAVLTELTNHIQDESLKTATKDWVSQMTALRAEDIANAIVYAVSQPWHVSVNELLIRPTDQSF